MKRIFLFFLLFIGIFLKTYADPIIYDAAGLMPKYMLAQVQEEFAEAERYTDFQFVFASHFQLSCAEFSEKFLEDLEKKASLFIYIRPSSKDCGDDEGREAEVTVLLLGEEYLKDCLKEIPNFTTDLPKLIQNDINAIIRNRNLNDSYRASLFNAVNTVKDITANCSNSAESVNAEISGRIKEKTEEFYPFKPEKSQSTVHIPEQPNAAGRTTKVEYEQFYNESLPEYLTFLAPDGSKITIPTEGGLGFYCEPSCQSKVPEGCLLTFEKNHVTYAAKTHKGKFLGYYAGETPYPKSNSDSEKVYVAKKKNKYCVSLYQVVSSRGEKCPIYQPSENHESANPLLKSDDIAQFRGVEKYKASYIISHYRKNYPIYWNHKGFRNALLENACSESFVKLENNGESIPETQFMKDIRAIAEAGNKFMFAVTTAIYIAPLIPEIAPLLATVGSTVGSSAGGAALLTDRSIAFTCGAGVDATIQLIFLAMDEKNEGKSIGELMEQLDPVQMVASGGEALLSDAKTQAALSCLVDGLFHKGKLKKDLTFKDFGKDCVIGAVSALVADKVAKKLSARAKKFADGIKNNPEKIQKLEALLRDKFKVSKANIRKFKETLGIVDLDKATLAHLKKLDPSEMFPKQFLLDIEKLTKNTAFPDFDLGDFIASINAKIKGKSKHNRINDYLNSFNYLKPDIDRLSKSEAYAVILYSSKYFYQGLNHYLRNGQRQLVDGYANLLDKALRKLPIKKAPVMYRGLKFDLSNPVDKQNMEKFIAQVQKAEKTKDKKITFGEFLSVSSKEGSSFSGLSQVKIQIFPAKGKTMTQGARDIDGLSVTKYGHSDPNYTESLYPTGSNFIVKSLEKKDGVWLLDLMEF